MCLETLCLPWGKANEGVSRPQRAQLSEWARFDSVLCGCPPREFGSASCKETAPSPSRGERGFFLSTARRAAPRGVVAVLGVRAWPTLPTKTSLEGLSRELQLATHNQNTALTAPITAICGRLELALPKRSRIKLHSSQSMCLRTTNGSCWPLLVTASVALARRSQRLLALARRSHRSLALARIDRWRSRVAQRSPQSRRRLLREPVSRRRRDAGAQEVRHQVPGLVRTRVCLRERAASTSPPHRCAATPTPSRAGTRRPVTRMRKPSIAPSGRTRTR